MKNPVDPAQLKELVSLASEKLRIKYPFIIEKDYYVTRLIHVFSNMENEHFRLVFAGGTCLAKAHKIVKRMSEDIDFKIQAKSLCKNFSKTRFLKELKQFRIEILAKLELPDFVINESVARNEGKYLRIELSYPTSFAYNTTLRPHILLEFALSDVRLPCENLAVETLIEETLEIPALFAPNSTCCISINETAIEKFVALTRRIIAIERKYHYDDPNLIRHVYDLNAIKYANKIDDNFLKLAKMIINYDAEQFKTQHFEYTIDPNNEIRQSLSILKNKSLWRARYQEFIETMVYEKTSVQSYENAIHILEGLNSSITSFSNETSKNQLAEIIV